MSKKATLDDIIKALGLDKKNKKSDSHAYGEVKSINSDGTYNVALNGSATTVKCARLAGAKVGDTVFVTILKNGFSVVTSTLGGDKDAADAMTAAEDAQDTADDAHDIACDTAQHFWDKETDGTADIPTGSYVTEYEKDEYTDPENANYGKGGSVLTRSDGLYLRWGLKTLVSLLVTGLKIFEPGDGTNPVLQALTTGIVIGKSNGLHIVIGSGAVEFWKDASTKIFDISLSSDSTPQARIRRSGTNTYGELYLTDTGSATVDANNTIGGGRRIAGVDTVALQSESSVIGMASYKASGSPEKSANLLLDAQASGTKARLHADDIFLDGDVEADNMIAGNVDAGYEVVATTAGTRVTKNVTFSKTFAAAPHVVAVANSTVPGVVEEVCVSNISTTGFDLIVLRSSNYDTGVEWIAIGV